MATDARQLVEAYLDALEAHDYDGARAFLADTGFEYLSPIASFRSADDLMEYSTLMGGIVQRIQRRKVFVDGNDVCHILVFVTQLAEKQSTPVVQWAQVENGRIRHIEVFFDAHRYKVMLRGDR